MWTIPPPACEPPPQATGDEPVAARAVATRTPEPQATVADPEAAVMVPPARIVEPPPKATEAAPDAARVAGAIDAAPEGGRG